MTYAEKLKHPKWQMMRLEILNRDHATCQLCGDKETELHVHHKEYRGQWLDPWEYKPVELVSLCKHCHYVVEDLKLNLNSDYPNVFKRINAEGVFLAIVYSEGLWMYETGKNTLVRVMGLNHKIMRPIIQSIINYWLRTENEHYLIQSNPAKTNTNAETTN